MTKGLTANKMFAVRSKSEQSKLLQRDSSRSGSNSSGDDTRCNTRQSFVHCSLTITCVQKPARFTIILLGLSQTCAGRASCLSFWVYKRRTTLLPVRHVKRLIIASFTVSVCSLWAQLGVLNITCELRYMLTSYPAQNLLYLAFVFKGKFPKFFFIFHMTRLHE